MNARVIIDQCPVSGHWRVKCHPAHKLRHLSHKFPTQTGAHSYGLSLWKKHGWPVWIRPTIIMPGEVVDLAAARRKREQRSAA